MLLSSLLNDAAAEEIDDCNEDDFRLAGGEINAAVVSDPPPQPPLGTI